jgi:hypothetical protein
MKPMFTLGAADFAKGVALAVIVAVLGAIEQALTAHGFELAAYDWASILNATFTAFVGYMTKNFLSDSQGKVGGAIG